MSDAWLLNSTEKLTLPLLFRVLHLSRIADAVLPLEKTSEPAKYLMALTRGNLDLFQRQSSTAKNILWELELWSVLRERSFDAVLSEPDILVNFGEARVGIACKKLYSDKHLQNVLSEAVSQVECNCDFGIAALCIDDLTPANSVLQVHSLHAAERFVNEINDRFLVVHDRHFRKYLASGRLLTVLVSTAVVADIAGTSVHLNNVRRSSIWTIPGLPTGKDAQLRKFYDQLMQ